MERAFLLNNLDINLQFLENYSHVLSRNFRNWEKNNPSSNAVVGGPSIKKRDTNNIQATRSYQLAINTIFLKPIPNYFLCKYTIEFFFALSFKDHVHYFACLPPLWSRTKQNSPANYGQSLLSDFSTVLGFLYYNLLLRKLHENRKTLRKTNKTTAYHFPHNSPIFHRLCFASSNCCLKTRKSMTSGISWYLITTEHITIKR